MNNSREDLTDRTAKTTKSESGTRGESQSKQIQSDVLRASAPSVAGVCPGAENSRNRLVFIFISALALMTAFASGFGTHVLVVRQAGVQPQAIQRIAAVGNASFGEMLARDVRRIESLADQLPCAGMWPYDPYVADAPAINTTESSKEITVTATLHSVEPKNISVRIQDNALMLSTKQEQSDISKGGDDNQEESSLSSFEAAIPLPAKVNAHEMRTSIQNGILIVVIPKA